MQLKVQVDASRVYVPECEFVDVGSSSSSSSRQRLLPTTVNGVWQLPRSSVSEEFKWKSFEMVINCRCRPREALADLLKKRIGDSKSADSIVSQLATTTASLRQQYLEEVGLTQYLVPERMVAGPRGLPAALRLEASQTKFLQTDVVFKYLQLSIGKQPHLESGSIGRQTFLDNSYGTTELGVPQRLLFQDNTAYPLVRKYVDCFYLTQSAQRLREVVSFVQRCLSNSPEDLCLRYLLCVA